MVTFSSHPTITSTPMFSSRPTVVVLASSVALQLAIEVSLDSVGLHAISFDSPREALVYLYLRQIWRRVEAPPIALILELDFASRSAPLKVVEELRQRAGFKELRSLPIFALTTNATRDSHRQAQEAGVNAAFLKPFRVQDIISALYSLLVASPGQR